MADRDDKPWKIASEDVFLRAQPEDDDGDDVLCELIYNCSIPYDTPMIRLHAQDPVANSLLGQSHADVFDCDRLAQSVGNPATGDELKSICKSTKWRKCSGKKLSEFWQFTATKDEGVDLWVTTWQGLL